MEGGRNSSSSGNTGYDTASHHKTVPIKNREQWRKTNLDKDKREQNRTQQVHPIRNTSWISAIAQERIDDILVLEIVVHVYAHGLISVCVF